MDADLLEKLTIVTFGVLIGFVVNRLYDWISNLCRRRKICSSLVDELTLVHDDVLLIRSIIEKKISGSEPMSSGSFSRKLHYPIYEKYYADVCLYLNKSQLSSFKHIYNCVDEINAFVSEFQTNSVDESYCVNLSTRKRLASTYSTTTDVLCLIGLHVEHHKKMLTGCQIQGKLALARQKGDRFLNKHGFYFD